MAANHHPASGDALIADWVAAQKSAHTQNSYRLDLATFGTWCAQSGTIPLRADASVVAAFQSARELVGDSPATLRRRWSSLASFYSYAAHNDSTVLNPMGGVRRSQVVPGNPSATPTLTADAIAEYQTLAAELDPRLEALVGLLVRDGLKLGESLALDIVDVTGKLAKTTVTVRSRGAVRRVLLSPETARSVRRCIDRRADGPLFVSDRSASRGRGHRLTRFGADHLLRRLQTSAGEGVTANALRRYHITHTHQRRGSLTGARLSAGLADVRSVRRFVTEQPEDTGDD